MTNLTPEELDKEYRDALTIEHVNTTLAIQIRGMRENHQWSQSDLADRLSKHQEMVSQWENPDYGRHSITTLKALAAQGGNNLPISEANWQGTLIALLKVYGYLVHAERPARNQKGWVTPIQGDAGFIDIVAAKIGRLLFIECKSKYGKLSEKQEDWRRVLVVSGAEYILARPQDYDYLKERLK